jgi:DNA polymerase III delta prime subunit
MMTKCTDRSAAEGGATRLSWLVALAGILLVAVIVVLEDGTQLLARRQMVEALYWVQANWLSTAAVGTMAAVAGVLAPFLIRWLDRRRPAQTAGEGRDALQRAVMLRRVRYKWITGVLEPSLAHAAQLVLDLERRPDLLHLGTRAVRRSGRPPESLPPGTPIIEAFDSVGGGLLIVGPPGVGKTTMLLQLCNELLDRAKRDAFQPIPILVNLASWARHRQPLGVWLVDELAEGYQVPRRIAAEWVEQDALVLLLDGLDEVADRYRVPCAEAVNAWRHQHGLVPVVVCSRTEELRALGARLRLEEALELQPPSDAEVDRYLGYLETTGTPISDLRATLTSDQELRQLLRSPLLLHVVTLTYHGRPPAALYAPGTIQQRQGLLWEAYAMRMFEQRPLEPGCGYTNEQALGWLSSLARALRDRDQTEFHLDRLAPEWLPTPTQQRRAPAAISIAGGLVAGLVLGLSFGLIIEAFGLRFGLLSGLVFGLMGGLGFGLVAGLIFGLSGGLTMRVNSSEHAPWSWSKLRRGFLRKLAFEFRNERAIPKEDIRPAAQNRQVAEAFGLAAGLTAGLFSGLAGGLAIGLYTALVVGLGCGFASSLVGTLSGVSVVPAEQMRWSWSRLRGGLTRALVAGLIGALVFGLIFGLAGGLAAGLIYGPVFGVVLVLMGGLAAGMTGGLRDERAIPNEGIRQSAQHALAGGMVAGLSAGLIGGLACWMGFGLAAGLAAGLGLTLIFALTVALMFGGGACLQHYVVRAWLVRERVAPWRYGRFLEAMAHRLLLRRSGSAYLFIHRLLRDHLAGL